MSYRAYTWKESGKGQIQISSLQKTMYVVILFCNQCQCCSRVLYFEKFEYPVPPSTEHVEYHRVRVFFTFEYNYKLPRPSTLGPEYEHTGHIIPSFRPATHVEEGRTQNDQQQRGMGWGNRSMGGLVMTRGTILCPNFLSIPS